MTIKDFRKANRCHICGKPYVEKEVRVNVEILLNCNLKFKTNYNGSYNISQSKGVRQLSNNAKYWQV